MRQDYNRSNSEHLLQIRVKTLTVLHHVDINRKRDIILFLYESRLLRSDIYRLDLTGADLSDMQFIGSSSSPLLLDFFIFIRYKSNKSCFSLVSIQ